MTIRSTLDIQVNDGAFRAYKAHFDNYQAAVAQLPGDWSKVSQSVGDSKKAFDDLVSKLVTQNYESQQYNLAQKAADQLVKNQVTSWKHMAISTRNIVTTVVSATENLIKWVGPMAVVTGLLGAAGGLFGLDRLAMSVAGGRRDIMGSGVQYGQRRAFETNFGRFVDTQSLIGNVSGSMYDATKPGYTALMAAGIPSSFIDKHNAADVSVELLQRLPALFAGMNKRLIGPKAQALGLTNLISQENIVSVLSAQPGELTSQIRNYKRDTGSLDINQPGQLAYVNFLTQLDRAGKTIETVLVRGLAKWAEPLTHLSEAVVKLVIDVAGSNNFKQFMDTIGRGIENLATYINSTAFENVVKDFGDWIGSMASTVKWAVDELIALGAHKATMSPNAIALGAGFRPGGSKPSGTFGGKNPAFTPSPIAEVGWGPLGKWWTSDRIKHAVDYLQKNAGLTQVGAAGLVARWSAIESRSGPGAVNPISGAEGIGQWLGSRKTGFTGEYDSQLAHAANELNTSEKKAGDYLRQATTPEQAATGASMFERAEGFNSSTGNDNFTGRTPVRSIIDVLNAPSPTPTIRSTTGATFVGDSLGVGLMKAGKGSGLAVVGASTKAVLGEIDRLPKAGDNKTIVLSTGASNDYSEAGMALITQQIVALKAKGYTDVRVVGVGDRDDFQRASVNSRLAEIAKRSGATFTGAIDPSLLSGDRVHPSNYGRVLSDEIFKAPGPLRPLAEGPTVTAKYLARYGTRPGDSRSTSQTKKHVRPGMSIYSGAGVKKVVDIHDNLGSGATVSVNSTH